MKKEVIKVILEILKNVDQATRPALYGARSYSHAREGEKSYIYISDGFRALKLECGGELVPVPLNDDVFMPGEKLKEEYKKMAKNDIYAFNGAIKESSAGFIKDGVKYAFNTPDYKELFKSFEGLEKDNFGLFDFDILKCLAPLGHAKMEILKTSSKSHALKVSGEGFEYIQMGLCEK